MDDWSAREVELIVSDYFDMLSSELRERPYVKAEHRRALLPELAGGSEGAVENKHRNISAVLSDLRQPYIHGYKPLAHYQELLRTTVVQALIERGMAAMRR